MIRIIVSTREEEAVVIAALGAAGLRDLDDYAITGAPPDAPVIDWTPGWDLHKVKIVSDEEGRQP